MLFFAALIAVSTAFAGEGEGAGERLVTVVDGKVYCIIDGDQIFGRDIIDLVLEEHWDKELESFVQHALTVEELRDAKIEVSDADAETELKYILDRFAHDRGLNPRDFTPEALAEHFHLPGGVAMLRRQIKENLGMLRLFQQLKILPVTAHTDDEHFRDALQQLLEKRVAERGVIRDPKQLGGGEAVRIGGRGYGHAEAREYLAESLAQMTEPEFHSKLDVLKLEKIVQHALAARKLEVTEKDLEDHYNYLCHQAELQPPYAPGRMVMQQMLSSKGLTPRQFIHSRIIKTDAGMTKISRAAVGYKDMLAEFQKSPQRYKRSENLVAHIFILVRDPEGRPYTSAWKIPGNGAINEYVGSRREEQFAAAKPEIECLVEPAKIDFEATAKKSSQDSNTASGGGRIGRIGPQTIVVPPCDAAMRDAAVKLKPGEMSGPVRSDFGWHLIKCLDKQEVTFDEAQVAVYVNLIHDAKEQLVRDLMNNARIEDKP